MTEGLKRARDILVPTVWGLLKIVGLGLLFLLFVGVERVWWWLRGGK